MKAQTLAAELLDLLLPRGCLACGERIPPEEGGELVCVRCRTLLRPPPSPRCHRCHVPLGTGWVEGAPCLECLDWPEILVFARAVTAMEPPADAMVHALKYDGWRSLSRLMGRRMAAVLPKVHENAILVPVPTTPRRRRMRGYDQAHLLARVVAEETEYRMVEALHRPRGGTQIRSDPTERRANVAGAFHFLESAGSRIRDAEVILIDDVLTTGATAVAAASVLGAAGAKSVGLLTFARALPFGGEGGRSSLA